MAIMIFANGCRRATDTGKMAVKRCDECIAQPTCELKPHSRELNTLIASQWIKTSDRLPPQAVAVLYVEYSPAHTGSIHYGYYDDDQQQFIEQGSNHALSKERVMAWMLVPVPPVELYEERWIEKSCQAAMNGMRSDLN
jgi:hypothetical protein